MNLQRVHMKHLKEYYQDFEALRFERSEAYTSNTMIETRVYEEDLHIETFYTQHLTHEKRYVSWCEDELE